MSFLTLQGLAGNRFVVAVIRDITDRKRAEEKILQLNVELEQRVRDRTVELEAANCQLRDEIAIRRQAQQAQARLVAILEATSDFVGFADAKSTRILYMNPAGRRMTGCGEEEDVTALSISDVHPAWANQQFRDEIFPAAARDGIWTGECTFRNRNGHETPVLMVLLAHKAPSGEVEIFSTISRDMTEYNRVQEEIAKLNRDLITRASQLEAAAQELEAFSYSVSHDLRAPLRVMDGYARAVMEEFGPKLPEEGRRYLNAIRTETRRMADLIDDLLEFSRLGRQSLHRQPVTTDKLVRAALDELGPEQRGRQVEIRIGDLPPCQGDPALLRQVWLNLLSNAQKFTLKCTPAVVEIGCTSRDGTPTYFIRDNGAGFDMRYAGKLFGVFQRLHRAEDYAGTGVGLAIVQQVIRRHGGRVWAEAAVGQGATFYFTLEGEPKA